MRFIETSAKAATKVQEAFETLATEIINANLNKGKVIEKKDKEKTIHLSSGVTDIYQKKKKGGCC